MWFEPRPLALARMPSTRAQPLNPQAPRPREGAAAPSAETLSGLVASSDDGLEHERAVRAGAFHESSYELRTGLEINESEWPDEITIPAALGKD
jgi:hypothetical protein